MKTDITRAMDFLRAAGNDWRNAMHIDCMLCTLTQHGCGGYLMIPDADGAPIFIQVQELSKALGYGIETTACNGRLLKSEFEKLYAAYLIWNVDDGNACPLRWLSKSNTCSGM